MKGKIGTSMRSFVPGQKNKPKSIEITGVLDKYPSAHVNTTTVSGQTVFSVWYNGTKLGTGTNTSAAWKDAYITKILCKYLDKAGYNVVKK